MNKMKRFLACVLLGALAAPAAAIIDGAAPPSSDRRFDAVCGVGYTNAFATGGNPICSGTLIAPNLVLTARHCIPTGGLGFDGGASERSVRFRRLPNGSLGNHDVEVTRWILNAQLYGYTDQVDAVIGVLAEDVEHIEPIRLSHSTMPLLLAPTDTEVAGAPVWVAGWGRQGPGIHEGPWGELRVRETTTSTSSGGRWVGGLSGPALHDSGGAVLYEDCWGNMRQVGIITGCVTINGVTGCFGPSVPGIANAAGMRRLPAAVMFSHLDLNGDGYLTHADYLLYMDGYFNSDDDLGVCADFNDSGAIEPLDRAAFLLRLLELGGTYCRNDINLDNTPNSNDISAFLTHWFAEDVRADVDLDGDVDQDDYTLYINEIMPVFTCP